MRTFIKDPERLRTQLAYAARHVPAYASFHAAVQRPGADVGALLATFPTTTKVDLVERGDALFALDMRSAAVICQTSGTTGGEVLVTPRSSEELRWNGANVAKAFARNLAPGRDRVALLNPSCMSPFAEACGLALMSLGVPFVRVFPIAKVMTYPRIRQILRDYRITVVMTTMTLANKLAFEWKKEWHGGGDGEGPLTKLLLTGELLISTSLANTGRLLRCAANAFVYGSSESATCAIGCASHRYHPCLDDFVFEVDTDDAASPTATGELLVTWLNTGIRPLVRYRTSDLATVVDRCECGQDGPAFEIHGRIASKPVSTRQRVALDEIVWSCSVPVYHYDLVLSERGTAALNVIATELQDAAARRVAREIRDRVIEQIGLEVDVVINPKEHEFLEFAPTTKTARVTEPR
jgi:phenylacetate-coenzyme A ligase PaaK-like adenylate-forming protein